MRGALRLILGDQLSHDLPTLRDGRMQADTIMLAEVVEEAAYVPHHKKKIAFLFSAMRHFAGELREAGWTVRYVKLDDPANAGSFSSEVERAVAELAPDRLVVTEPGEWRVLQMMRNWRETLPVPVEIREDTRFLCSAERFAHWAAGRKSLRLEHFYREMRVAHQVLLREGQPEGGRWNFDAENRQRLPDAIALPKHPEFAPDSVTADVLDLVIQRFGHHPGSLTPFSMPVTRRQALSALEHFMVERLPQFGDYQDAMKRGEPQLFHSMVSAALNCGLLGPMETIRRAEHAYHAGQAPLNAVEGFIRQILGWREFVRGLYWLKMPDYAHSNALNAVRPLPDFYWTGETEMDCLRQVIGETLQYAHAHHIQRLMVTGNFALLAGLAPAEVEEWYLSVYADAYEWVELPNTHGMALFADGGVFASKPYAASGNYIDRMSDYCASCRYDVKKRTGPDACPFNYLYWNFLIANERLLRANPRMSVIYGNIDRMTKAQRDGIASSASAFLDGLKPWARPTAQP